MQVNKPETQARYSLLATCYSNVLTTIFNANLLTLEVSHLRREISVDSISAIFL